VAADRDDELTREIQAHLELEAEERIEAGMSPAEAQAAARRAFGNVTHAQEDVRALFRRAWLEALAQDVRYALRTLARNPGFATVAILTLALGIGANTAIFSLVHAVLLRPLPFADPDRLAVVWADFTARGGPSTVQAAPADFVDWKAGNDVFADMAAVDGVLQTFNLTGAGEPERLSGAKVTANLFPLLGLGPIAGRTLLPEDDRAGAEAVVLISEGLWRRRFGASATLVGQPIRLNDVPHTVVGIIPGHFQFPTPGTDVWVPAAFTPEQLARRGSYFLNVLARLSPGVSLEQARAGMVTLADDLRQQYPATNALVGINVVPLHDQYASGIRPMLTALLGTVGVVLLIACVNVAHLLLARGAARRKEIALRGALGAGRGRILRQLLTESLVLAVGGAIVGAAFAALAFRFLSPLVPDNYPEATGAGLDPVVLLFTGIVALVTSVAFGAGPSLAMVRQDVNEALKQAGTHGPTRRERRIRGALAVAEVAMTVVLLVAAGLLLRSYAAVESVELGFPSQGLLVAETPMSPSRYGEGPRRAALVSAVLDRVGQLPGVVSAGYVNYLPLVFKGGRVGFTIDGRPTPAPGQFPQQIASDRAVSPDYFRTMGIPLVAGRHFDERDGQGAPLAVMINQTMARRFWGSSDPLGQRIRIGGPTSRWLTVTGIIGDVRQMGLEVAAEPELYLSLDQVPSAAPFFWPRYLVVRTAGDPIALAPAVRRAVAGIDADQPVSNMRSMQAVIGQELAGRANGLTLIGAFALLALLLAAVGLYGVLAYTVAQQTREIGLRMALGATRTDVMGALVRRTMWLTGLGIAVGLAGAAAVTRTMTSFLYQVSPTDPVTFAAGALLLVVVALLACWAPARRATRVDPLTALRAE